MAKALPLKQRNIKIGKETMLDDTMKRNRRTSGLNLTKKEKRDRGREKREQKDKSKERREEKRD